jgi:hypothetical protein
MPPYTTFVKLESSKWWTIKNKLIYLPFAPKLGKKSSITLQSDSLNDWNCILGGDLWRLNFQNTHIFFKAWAKLQLLDCIVTSSGFIQPTGNKNYRSS